MARSRATLSLNQMLRTSALAAAVGAIGFLGGCKNFIDQSDVSTRLGGERLVVPIISSIDPIDETEVDFAGAADVRAEDLKVVATDYVIGRNDLVTVSVFDLINQGVESVRTARVSETGLLSLPMLPDPIKAAGLTEAELQKAIAARYREAGLIQNAQVSVQVVEARQRTFSVMGAVARPGQYVILDADFRLLNALIQAGDTAGQVDYVYVVRKLASEKPAAPSTQPTDTAPKPPKAGEDPLAPKSEGPARKDGALASAGPLVLANQAPAQGTQPKPAPAPEGDQKYIFVDGKPRLINTNQTQPSNAQPAGNDTAVQPPRDLIPPRDVPSTTAQPTERASGSYEFGSESNGIDDQRVIRVPLAQLKAGDMRYNIVIRPNDLIIAPIQYPGFYYMGGHVGSPGAYSLNPNQKMNLKQAVIAARMLDPLAVPQRCDIIRRIGADKEVFVRVNLEKVFDGREPDIFLKANDIVQVGTDWWPPFLAAVRGGFRFSYGLGFIYDRNFSPQQKLQD